MTPTGSRARHVISWLFFVAAGIVVIASTVQAFTADPQQGEGWIGGPIQAVFMGGPLIAIGFGLRSVRRSVARKTAVASFLLALVVGFVMVMQILDANEILSDILVTCAGVVVYLAGFIVELPAFTDRWPPNHPTDTPDSRDRSVNPQAHTDDRADLFARSDQGPCHTAWLVSKLGVTNENHTTGGSNGRQNRR